MSKSEWLAGRMRRAAVILMFVLSFFTPVFGNEFRIVLPDELINSSPKPFLLYPLSDKVILGKDPIEFRWRNDFIRTDHFVFKIYKGYNMYVADLIYKKDVLSQDAFIKIKPDLFEEKQVYSWSLIRVSLDGIKSEKSVSSFKAVKK